MLAVANPPSRSANAIRSMPITYRFKDSRVSDSVAKALLFVSKFSKKQAYVRLSDSSVSVIWGGSPKTFYIHAGTTSLDMFSNRTKHYGIDHCTVIQVDPSILGKTLKGFAQDKSVSICFIKRPNRIQISVRYDDASRREITHNIPCEFKTQDDYKSMLIEEIETSLCRFNTRSYVDNVHRLKHIIETFVRLNTARVYILSKQSHLSNDLTITARTQGSNIHVSVTDLEGDFEQQQAIDYEMDEDNVPKRTDAGVNIETKKLALFLSGLVAHKRSRLIFDIEHNKCLKITHDHEISQGEKFYQSILLLHSLNN